MAYKKIEDYKSIKFRSFPSERRENHLTKKEEWYISYLSTMLHRYVTGSGSELKYEWEHLKTLEKYAKGTQGNRKVKEKMLSMQKDGTFKGRVRDIFQTYDILPEMIDVILATNMKSDYKPQSVAVDEMSVKDKNLEISMAKFLIEKNTKDFLNFMSIKVDSQLTDEEIAVFTSADIDILYQTGGIQMQRERDSVSVCNTSMLASSHKEIENLNSFDAITYAMCATRTYWDYNESLPKYRYVDVKNLIIPNSKYNDFRDITYAAELRMMTLSEVISECPDITNQQIEDLVRANHSFNADFSGLESELQAYKDGKNDIFDEYRIAVLDAQWLATDIEVYLQSPTSTGGELYKKVSNDFEIKPKKARQGQKLDRKQYVKRYSAKWVIGSDILLDYGQASNNVYYGPRGARIPKLDFNIVKTGKKSLVDRCRTIVDDINLAIAKLRSAIATLPPAPRMVVYDHALQNIKMGNVLQSPKDLFDGFSQNGILVVNGRDHKGNVVGSNGGKAVEFMTSGLAEDITIFSNEVITKVSMLRQVLGLPEGLDGTAGQKYQLASTMALAASASSNALFPTTSIIGPLYEKTFDNVVTLAQAMCRDKEISIQEIGLSERVVNTFKIAKDFSNYDFRIKILFQPTEAEKEFLINKINEASALYVQSSGTMGITQAEFLMLYKLIKAGLIDEAMMRIARIEKLRQEANIKAQEATIATNSQQQMESNRVAEEEKRKTAAIVEGQKRLSISMEKAMEGINDLQKIVLSSTETENRPVSAVVANPMIDTNKGFVANILDADAQTMQPSVPEEQMQEQPI